MRVLLVHDYGAPFGGADAMTIALRDDLRRRGHDAWLFSSSAEPYGTASVADIECLGTLGPARQVLQVANPWAASLLRRTVARLRPDVVHVTIYATQLSPLVLRELGQVPAVLYVCNYDQVCPTNSKLLPDGGGCRHRAGLVCLREGCLPPQGLARFIAQRRLSDRWRRNLRQVVSCSAWIAEGMADDGLVVDAVVPNGVPRSPPRPPLEGPPTAAFAGRLVPKKGVAELIGAWGRVLEQVPDARLVVAGEGPQRSVLEALAGARALGDRVRFLGHLSRERMETELSRAWVQVVPSTWHEPFGMVAAEAMMRGTAVVASRAGGLPEFVLDGVTGHLVPPGDEPALASALVTLLGDREEAERLGAAGRVHAVEELGSDRFTDRLLAIYQRAVG